MPAKFEPAAARCTLFSALIKAARQFGKATPILEDQERTPLSYGRLIIASLVLGEKIAAFTRRGETVGVLLPSVMGVGVVVFGLNAFGRVAALLNFTAGTKNLRSAVRTGQIHTILTSRRFIDNAKLDDVVAALANTTTGDGSKVRIVYLEELRKTISGADKLKGAVKAAIAGRVHARHSLGPEAPAVVLFTSGTEGAPKGVVLTNINLVSNAYQIIAHASGFFSSKDVVLNPLPVFHCFGLTAAMLMPIFNGMRTVLYPSPLHYKQVPKLIRETRATVLFATDTFLQGYIRAADPGDLDTVRFAVAGAERVKDATRTLWARTGTTILEGYGATECSPVICCNLPHSNRSGSVGPVLQGMDVRLDPVEGIHDGGRLMVSGPNVMAGYLFAEEPGKIVPPKDGWHDTGDICLLGEDRFVVIQGRAKRFAKIGGEMVSLAAVEAMAASIWPGANHVVVSLPDQKKGEQLVLVTEQPDAERGALQVRARQDGYPELWLPRAVLVVANIPVLGSGKVDYAATAELARTMRSLI